MVVHYAQITVLVVALGIRKDGSKQDVYALAKKLLRLGLLEETDSAQIDDQNPES